MGYLQGLGWSRGDCLEIYLMVRAQLDVQMEPEEQQKSQRISKDKNNQTPISLLPVTETIVMEKIVCV